LIIKNIICGRCGKKIFRYVYSRHSIGRGERSRSCMRKESEYVRRKKKCKWEGESEFLIESKLIQYNNKKYCLG